MAEDKERKRVGAILFWIGIGIGSVSISGALGLGRLGTSVGAIAGGFAVAMLFGLGRKP